MISTFSFFFLKKTKILVLKVPNIDYFEELISFFFLVLKFNIYLETKTMYLQIKIIFLKQYKTNSL